MSMLTNSLSTKFLLKQDFEDNDQLWVEIPVDDWKQFSNLVALATGATLTDLELPQAAFVTNTNEYREDRLVFLLQVLSQRQTDDCSIMSIKLTHFKHHSPAALKTIGDNFPHLKVLELTNVHNNVMPLPHAFAEVLVKTIHVLCQLEDLQL